MSASVSSTRHALVLSENGRFRAEIPLVRDRLRIGRRQHNDLTLDDLTVSADHALLEIDGDGFLLRDLGSRNGTFVNGQAVRESRIQAGDTVDIGIYRLRLVPSNGAATTPAEAGASDAESGAATLEYLDGPHAGITQRLDRNIVRIGDSGTQVAVVARRRSGYVLTHLEGMATPVLNGAGIGPGASPLADGDLIELAGARIRFRLRG